MFRRACSRSRRLWHPPGGRARIARLLAGVVGLALACSPAAPPPPPGDILLVTVDTLRADHLGLYGYARPTSPWLDRFFAEGIVVERAYATEANTSPSVVSILSGLLPQEHRVRLLHQLLPDGVQLIPDRLPDAYVSAAFVSNSVLADEAMGLARHFDHYDDDMAETVVAPGARLFERGARATTDAALRWLRSERDPARPLFLWVHYIDPHGPYRAPEGEAPVFEHEGQVRIDVTRLSKHVREPGVDDGLEYVDRYDREIAYTDAQVGRLLDGYAELAPIERALVVFTADHAESMMEHELWFSHGHHVYDEVVRVPFMLRGPGVPRGRVEVVGSGIDVAPTILGFAGVESPAGLAGLDLRALDATASERLAFAEATSPISLLFGDQARGEVGYWRAVVKGDRKWVVGLVRGDRTVREERYYDLSTDPGELDPRGALGDADLQAGLLDRIASDPDPGGLPQDLKRGMQRDSPKVAPGVTPEQRERLRALGYVE